ncbi:hypothetical protein ACH4CE_36470 [Streptomyces gelaticus]|uniref:competence protein CoiA family protein n=1 Tax=Streptomyces gelaticus TaxID=285446 RepID=UPI0037904866
MSHKELGAINLSELDLTSAGGRRLWESLHGKTVRGDLECLECRENDPGCPQWMFLRLWKGRPVAVHYSTGVRHPTAPESPRHKALKERIARVAERAGFSADLEACAADGRRRTDVLVHGENGLQLGCEIQLSYATAHSVTKRSDIARADGLPHLSLETAMHPGHRNARSPSALVENTRHSHRRGSISRARTGGAWQ